jgi:hypothetical protein
MHPDIMIWNLNGFPLDAEDKSGMVHQNKPLYRPTEHVVIRASQ